MNTSNRLELLSTLGHILSDVSLGKTWNHSQKHLTEEQYDFFLKAIDVAHIHNGWFTKDNIIKSLKSISIWLNKGDLTEWLNHYPSSNKPKKIALIMAGNIPLVGFHDFLSVFLSGHIAVIKLSSDDKHLFPAVLNIMNSLNSGISECVEVVDGKLTGFDAVIATGSDNSALYFESYFGKYPNIIRKNRTSIAIINGKETKEELKKIGDDIFSYYGLGCRNISQILVPENFKLDDFFEAIYDYNGVINHNKYANNYDYNKAVYLMNLETFLDNGFVLLKEDDSLNSPLAVIFYKRYKNQHDIDAYLNENAGKIQVIIGKDYTGFGDGQSPTLTDYADGIDTMAFLNKL